MSPVTHLLASWLVAAKTTDDQRDCRLVTLAGIMPDADGLPLVVDLVTVALGGERQWFYQQYHHFWLHGLPAGVLLATLACWLARRKLRVFVLFFAVFHLHLLCDLLASRGPSTADLWPIHYLGPIDRSPMVVWAGQWPLDSWPNRVLTILLMGWALWLPVQLGHSVVGVFHRRADAVFVGVLRKWWEQLGGRSGVHGQGPPAVTP